MDPSSASTRAAHNSGSTSGSGGSDSDTPGEQPSNIVNVALRIPHGLSDVSLGRTFQDFCTDSVDLFREKKVRRVTFIVLRPKEFPKYFTYRSRNGFKEDLVYRHLEPALAFQVYIVLAIFIL